MRSQGGGGGGGRARGMVWSCSEGYICFKNSFTVPPCQISVWRTAAFCRNLSSALFIRLLTLVSLLLFFPESSIFSLVVRTPWSSYGRSRLTARWSHTLEQAQKNNSMKRGQSSTTQRTMVRLLLIIVFVGNTFGCLLDALFAIKMDILFYLQDQNRLSTGHGIRVLVGWWTQCLNITGSATAVMWPYHVGYYFSVTELI